MKKLIYPVFIPMQGCPHRCIYCDQTKISGAGDLETQIQLEAAREFIKRHPGEAKEIAFYGGSFTALSQKTQTELAEAVLSEADEQTSLRISTHPLYIDDEILENCRNLRIHCIELGIQDFCDEVLIASGRGYDSATAVKACRLVKQNGFLLGLQLMPGLPIVEASSGRLKDKLQDAASIIHENFTEINCRKGVANSDLKVVEASSGRLKDKLQDAASTIHENFPEINCRKGVANSTLKVVEASSGRFGDKLQDAASTIHENFTEINCRKGVANSTLKVVEASSGRLENKLQDAASTSVNMQLLRMLKPDYLRLYPLIVIKGTPLEGLYLQGKYQPLELEAAVELCADYAELCENEGIKLIKIGLPSNLNDSDIVCGPWHPAFGEFVLAERLVRQIITARKAGTEINLDKKQRALIMAHGGKYKAILEKRLETCCLKGI